MAKKNPVKRGSKAATVKPLTRPQGLEAVKPLMRKPF
jgi:hypothetical protein